MLGPNEDDAEKDDISSIRPTRLPAALSLSHTNAFHVWDQDDVVIPLPSDDSPQMSPLLLATIPYIPSFFPTSSSNNSPSVPNSPGLTSTIPRDVWEKTEGKKVKLGHLIWFFTDSVRWAKTKANIQGLESCTRKRLCACSLHADVTFQNRLYCANWYYESDNMTTRFYPKWLLVHIYTFNHSHSLGVKPITMASLELHWKPLLFYFSEVFGLWKDTWKYIL